MTLKLFRVTEPGEAIDIPNNIPADEIIDFNATDDVNNPNAFIVTYDLSTTTGIGNNQAAEEDLGDHQDLGQVELLYILRGFISQRDKSDGTTVGFNPFIDILEKWDTENKTNDNFKHGRFGIIIEDMSRYSLAPVGTGSTTQQGMIWRGIYWGPMDYEEHPLRANFEIHLIVDKGDDQ